MSNTEMNFINSVHIDVVNSTLIFKINGDSSKENSVKYYGFTSILIDGLDIGTDNETLDIINKSTSLNMNKYYKGDPVNYLCSSNNIKLFWLKIDFRDKEFPNVFDGILSIELTVSDIKNNLERAYRFSCSGTDKLYEKIKNSNIG